MCGILGGVFNLERIDRSAIELAVNAIAHRGPDAYGIIQKDNLFLAHQRLSIVDLNERSNQPFRSPEFGNHLAFNGEVYNYKALAKKHNIDMQTSSDTELIISLCNRIKHHAFGQFNGMFSLAIDIGENELLLARDRFGIKPLFYYKNGNDFAFASELKGLLALGPIQRQLEINYDSIPDFLHLGYIPEPNTFFKHIHKFPAGHYGYWSNGELNLVPYYQLKNKISTAPIHDFQEAKTQFFHIFEQSVSDRLMSDVPFGTFLSCGVDSSLVTAMAQKVSDKPLNTFSIGIKDKPNDEAHFAKAVADELGTNHHTFLVTHKDAIDLNDKMLSIFDEPYADSSSLPTMLVSKLARQHVTMTLSGDGGDELFMGYGAYKWAKRLSNKAFFASAQLGKLMMSQMPDRYKRVAKLLDLPRNQGSIPAHIFSQEQYFFRANEIQKLLNKPLVFLPNIDFDRLNRKLSAAERQAFFDIHYYLKDDLLTKVDRSSMQFSLEARVPFLDHRLVEFAINLDDKLKVQQGELKFFLKQRLYEMLPKQLFDRPKAGFNIPLNQWLQNELAYLVDEHLLDNNQALYNQVNEQAIKKLVSQYRSGQTHLYNRAWLLIILSKYLRQYA